MIGGISSKPAAGEKNLAFRVHFYLGKRTKKPQNSKIFWPPEAAGPQNSHIPDSENLRFLTKGGGKIARFSTDLGNRAPILKYPDRVLTGGANLAL